MERTANSGCGYSWKQWICCHTLLTPTVRKADSSVAIHHNGRYTLTMVNETGALTLPSSGKLQIDVRLTAQVNISAVVARRKVNSFLAMQVGNLFLAGEPVMTLANRIVWRVPVDLTTPGHGRRGQVGQVDVDIENGQLLLDEAGIALIRQNAQHLVASSAS